MAKQGQDKVIISTKFSKVYAEYKDKAFDVFFDSCIKSTLQKNKSIYDLIQFCFTAGYWNAMRDIVNNKDLHDAAEKIVKEINEQE
jgi:hypothetical protein